ncbi:MAG: ferric uptake regulator family protein [Candidatus Sedimenticola endophacoides]
MLHATMRIASALILVGHGAVQAADPSFAEPRSGKKVSSYEVELPVARDARALFRIPGDCALAVENAWLAGAQQWGGWVDRSIWWKVRRDCDYMRFLAASPPPPMHDFVRGYDYRNAYLSDLSPGLRCGADAGCLERQRDEADISSLLPRSAPFGLARGRDSSAPCRLENGVFRGWLDESGAGGRCVMDRASPGFRILAVDYADVNGDGYQDVVLRVVALGAGMRRAPQIVPLTRTAPDGPFSIPENVTIPRQ